MPSLSLIVLLLLVALPLLEIAVLIKVGGIIGVWPTLAIIVGTFIAGMTVVRQQGLGVARRMMERVRAGEPPAEPMMEGMLLMVAGACLIAPGLILDCIGLLLLIPPLRQAAARWILTRGVMTGMVVRSRSRRRWSQRGEPQRPRRNGPAPTIEADYERIDEKQRDTPQPPSGTPPRG
jgi:UPF0716 protein FxsA